MQFTKNIGNSKIPGDDILRRHIEAGMDRREIAERYGVKTERVAARLSTAGLLAEERALAASKGANVLPQPEEIQPGIHIHADRVVYVHEMTAGFTGGVAIGVLSLPKISMHVDYLRETGQCR